MFLANFKNIFSNFLAQRLQRWADFLRQNEQPTNLKEANPPEPPENSSPLADWFQKTSGKPPQDWVERVSRDAPQLLFEMPEFTVQTTGASENDTLPETAQTGLNQFQTDRRKNNNSVKNEAAQEVQQKPESIQPVPNPASKTNPKQRFSSLKLFASRSKRQHESATNISISSDNLADSANKNAFQTDSTATPGQSLPLDLRQTSIIKLERRETQSTGESDSTVFKISRTSANDSRRQFDQTDHRPIKFRSRTVSDITQNRVSRREAKNQENESDKSDKSASFNQAATKAIQLLPDNFVIPPENDFHHEKTAQSVPLTKRNQPMRNNFLSPQSEKIVVSNLATTSFPLQENQWADLPQSTESANEYELFECENRRLRRIEAEQMGGEWNE